MKLSGLVWKYGDRLRAIDIVPADYDQLSMSHEWQGCADHLLERHDPAFRAGMKSGDILVAGHRLGNGHAHYYMAAIMACKVAGVGAMLCESVNTLFQRASIDQGYPTWAMPGITEFVAHGDELEINLATGDARNISTGKRAAFRPISPLILDILKDGGSFDWALNRVKSGAIAA